MHATVRDGLLTLPHGTQYRVLVLPRQETMRPEVLERVMQLVHDGAVVLGPAPMRSPSLAGYPEADSRVQAMAAELWGPEKGKHVNRYGKGMVFDGYSMEEVFEAIGLVPDFGHDASLQLLFGHRTTDGAEIYFVSNQSEEPVEFTASFRVANRRPEWWQPVTGAVRDLPAWRAEGAVTEIPMRLEPLESGFVVFRKPAAESVAEFTVDANFPRPELVAAMDGPWQVRFEAPDGVGNFTLATDTLGCLLYTSPSPRDCS